MRFLIEINNPFFWVLLRNEGQPLNLHAYRLLCENYNDYINLMHDDVNQGIRFTSNNFVYNYEINTQDRHRANILQFSSTTLFFSRQVREYKVQCFQLFFSLLHNITKLY